MNKPKVIVSLTTHSVRTKSVGRVINKILNSTFKDLKVVLTLYKDDIPLLADDVKFLIEDKTIDFIEANEDLGPHLKYFYAMQKYRDLPVITIDDDILYPDTMVEELYNAYLKYKCVTAQKCFEILHTENGELVYNFPMWCNYITRRNYPTHEIFATGVGGILYPPDCFKLSNDNIPEILDSKFDDDFYLKALEIRNDIKVFATKHNYNELYDTVLDDPETQSIALWNSNINNSTNSIKKFNNEFLKAITK